MAQSFNKNNCFGANRESIEAGDYIQKKKARATYCNSNVCIKKNTGTYEKYNLLHAAQQLDTYNCYLPFNKYDLNRNLFTELDTSSLCVLRDASNNACATRIDPSLNIFDSYIIDPSGVLFGNSDCGSNNFVNLMTEIKPLFEIRGGISYKYTYKSGYYIITFQNSNGYNQINSNYNIKFNKNIAELNYILVGGGGGGGSNYLSNNCYGGGGGAGGCITNSSINVSSESSYNISVGYGGNIGQNVSDSSGNGGTGGITTFSTFAAQGGQGGYSAITGSGGVGVNGGKNGGNGFYGTKFIVPPTNGSNATVYYKVPPTEPDTIYNMFYFGGGGGGGGGTSPLGTIQGAYGGFGGGGGGTGYNNNQSYYGPNGIYYPTGNSSYNGLISTGGGGLGQNGTCDNTGNTGYGGSGIVVLYFAYP